MATTLISLDSIVKKALAKAGLSIHYYIDALLYCRECLTENHFNFMQFVVEKKVTVSADGILEFPDGYIDWVSLTDEDADRNIAILGNKKYSDTLLADEYIGDGYTAYLQLDDYKSKELTLTYTTSSLSPDGVNYVHPYAENMLSSYVLMNIYDKMPKRMRAYNQQKYVQDYYNAVDVTRARFFADDLNEASISRALIKCIGRRKYEEAED